MKIKQAIYKIASSIYYQQMEKMTSMPIEEYQKLHWCASIFPFRWKNPSDNYKSDNRFHTVLNNLLKRCPSFKFKGTMNFGLYEIQYNLSIQATHNHGRKSEIISRIYLQSEDFPHKISFYTSINRIELNHLSDFLINESSIERTIRQHLAEYLHSDGLIARIQYHYHYTKKEALWRLKSAIKEKSFHRYPAIDDSQIRSIIKKRFNIDSYVDLDKTIQIVNQIGKQKEIKQVFGFDTSFIHSFDGDIDELEEEFHNANPIDRNTIYV